ncbi:MAG: hypothetical protein R2713_14720 [Ilumatobacteraceae bacterium]
MSARLGVGSALVLLARHQHTDVVAAHLRHQRDGSRIGRGADGRVQGVRSQKRLFRMSP